MKKRLCNYIEKLSVFKMIEYILYFNRGSRIRTTYLRELEGSFFRIKYKYGYFQFPTKTLYEENISVVLVKIPPKTPTEPEPEWVIKIKYKNIIHINYKQFFAENPNFKIKFSFDEDEMKQIYPENREFLNGILDDLNKVSTSNI